MLTPDDPKDMGTLIRGPDEGAISLVSFDRADRRLLAVDNNGVCQIWELPSGNPTGPRWETGGHACFASFGPNDDWVVTVHANGQVQLWDPHTGQPLGPPQQHGAHVNDAALSHTGSLLATAGSDGAVRIWNLHISDSHLPQQISPLAQLLCVQKLSGDTLVPLDQSELDSFDFDRGRRKYPEILSVSKEDVVSWQARQVADSKIRKQQDAATFHVKSNSVNRDP